MYIDGEGHLRFANAQEAFERFYKRIMNHGFYSEGQHTTQKTET